MVKLSFKVFGVLMIFSSIILANKIEANLIKANDLLLFPSLENKNTFDEIISTNSFVSLNITNSIAIAQQQNKDYFFSVAQTFRNSDVPSNFFSIVFPFSPPVSLTIKKTAVTVAYDLIAKLSKTNPSTAQQALLAWYINAPESNVLANIHNRKVILDLKAEPNLHKLNHAYQRIFNLWQKNIVTNANDYNAFQDFIAKSNFRSIIKSKHKNFDKAIMGLCKSYVQYIQQALGSSNFTLGAQIIVDANSDFPDNYLITRSRANYELRAPFPNFSKVKQLNNKACKQYREIFDRPYFDAIFANILAYRKYDSIPQTVAKLSDLRTLAIDQSLVYNQLLTNAFKQNQILNIDGLTNKFVSDIYYHKGRCLFWESQCNSYIALVLIGNKNYEEAQPWLLANMEAKFNPKVNEVATLRLASILIEMDNITDIIAFFDLLIEKNDDLNNKIDWLIQKSNFLIDHEMPALAYQTMQSIDSLLFQIDETDRQKWFANNTYSRVFRHLNKLLASDIRENIIPILIKRGESKNDLNAFLQVAQLYRCMIKYDQADSYFFKAGAESNLVATLESAMMQYKLQRFPKANNIFVKGSAVPGFAIAISNAPPDWRFVALSILNTRNRPALFEEFARPKADFEGLAHYYNYQANVANLFNNYDQTTNYFYAGIDANPNYIDNYLDLGYQLCRKGAVAKVTALIDLINAVELDAESHQKLLSDWRYITLFHVSGRPYSIENADE